MGCGSSSLKGDDVPNVNSQPVTTTAPAGQAIKKVKTNFSEVDYEHGIQHRRLTEYAPHETPAPVREESRDYSAEQEGSSDAGKKQQFANDGLAPNQPNPSAGNSTAQTYPHEAAGSAANAIDGEPETTLKPYQTTDGGDWDNDDNTSRQNPTSQAQQAQTYVNGNNQQPTDPTSNYAKDVFASANDPANPSNQESHSNNSTNHQTHDAHPAHQAASNHLGPNDENRNNNGDDGTYHDSYTGDINDPENDQSEHKKSWIGQKYSNFQSTKRGTGPSDEDVLKYTGKDKQELGEWTQGRSGVGGNQDGSRAGTDNGLATGASWN